MRVATCVAACPSIIAALLLGSHTRALAQAAASRSTSPGVSNSVILTIEGGGSLGVYEAGMTWTFIELFKPGRDGPSLAERLGMPRLTLGAVSGASAGSINALLAATDWCIRPSSKPPEESLFWQAWVPTGLQQLLPRFQRPGWDEGGLFSRVYFNEQIFKRIRAAWSAADWSDPANCHVPVAATVTRLVPAVVGLPHSEGVEARSQRFAATFEVSTKTDASGANQLAFRKLMIPEPTSLDIRELNHEVATDAILPIFEASSGYPLAFQPRPLAFRENVRDSVAQFADGGVFDNGPLGLGFETYFRSANWPFKLVQGSDSLPMAIYIAPDSRRHWLGDSRREFSDTADSSPKLVDPTARGLEAVFRLAAGFVPAARTYELQETIRTLSAIDSVRTGGSSDSTLVRVTTRWHPIIGDWLEGFAGFLGRPFREYDFYVGIYDGFAMVARHGRNCATVPVAGLKECVGRTMRALIDKSGVNLGEVAPRILDELWKKEFGDTAAVALGAPGDSPFPVSQAARPRNDGTSTDVMLALVRGTAALMQDSTPPGKANARALRQCDDSGLLADLVCAEGLASVLATVRNDTLAMRVLRRWHDANKAACSRKAGNVDSDVCLADEQLMQLIANPAAEMDRVAQLLIERLLYTTPPGGLSYKVVAGIGFVYFSGNERYRRGFDAGQTSLPPMHRSSTVLWRLVPSYAGGSLGMQAANIGWETRYNPASRLALVIPGRVVISRPDGGDSSITEVRGWDACVHRCYAFTPVIGSAIEVKFNSLISSVRLGADYWLKPRSDSSAFFKSDQISPTLGIFFLGGKLRTSLSLRPTGSVVNRSDRFIGEIDVGDLNGLLFWGSKIFATPRKN